MSPIQLLERRIDSLNYRKQYALQRMKIENGKTKITVRYLDKLFYKLREEKIGTIAKWDKYLQELNTEIMSYKRVIKTLNKYGR